MRRRAPAAAPDAALAAARHRACGMGCSGSGGPALDCEEDLTPVPSRFWVRLHRGADDLVGASLGDTEDGAVLMCVKEGGILHKWNRSNPSRAIRPGYIIEEINGARGYWNLLDMLRNQGPLVFKVSTVPPESAGPDWFEEIAATAKEMGESPSQSQFMVRLQKEEKGFVLPSPRGMASPRGRERADRSILAPLPGVTGSAAGVDQCAICQEDVGPTEVLVQLPCGHAYHALCAARWLVRFKSETNQHTEDSEDGLAARHAASEGAEDEQVACPLCRRELVSTKKGVARSLEGNITPPAGRRRASGFPLSPRRARH